MAKKNKPDIKENLSRGLLNTKTKLATTDRISDKEKKIFIAPTAMMSSVAVLSMQEYQFRILGTKKMHIPKPIKIMLPKVVSMVTRILISHNIFR